MLISAGLGLDLRITDLDLLELLLVGQGYASTAGTVHLLAVQRRPTLSQDHVHQVSHYTREQIRNDFTIRGR